MAGKTPNDPFGGSLLDGVRKNADKFSTTLDTLDTKLAEFGKSLDGLTKAVGQQQPSGGGFASTLRKAIGGAVTFGGVSAIESRSRAANGGTSTPTPAPGDGTTGSGGTGGTPPGGSSNGNGGNFSISNSGAKALGGAAGMAWSAIAPGSASSEAINTLSTAYGGMGNLGWVQKSMMGKYGSSPELASAALGLMQTGQAGLGTGLSAKMLGAIGSSKLSGNMTTDQLVGMNNMLRSPAVSNAIYRATGGAINTFSEDNALRAIAKGLIDLAINRGSLRIDKDTPDEVLQVTAFKQGTPLTADLKAMIQQMGLPASAEQTIRQEMYQYMRSKKAGMTSAQYSSSMEKLFNNQQWAASDEGKKLSDTLGLVQSTGSVAFKMNTAGNVKSQTAMTDVAQATYRAKSMLAADAMIQLNSTVQGVLGGSGPGGGGGFLKAVSSIPTNPLRAALTGDLSVLKTLLGGSGGPAAPTMSGFSESGSISSALSAGSFVSAIATAGMSSTGSTGTSIYSSSSGSSGGSGSTTALSGNVGQRGSDHFIKPAPGPFTAYFGAYPTRSGHHSGIDIGCPIGTPVSAALGGRVVYTATGTTSYGNHIIIDHGGGVWTLYAHLSVISTGMNAVVSQGQRIGSSGDTGNVSGPHLHFEVRLGSNSYYSAVDPLPYLTGAKLVPGGNAPERNTTNSAKNSVKGTKDGGRGSSARRGNYSSSSSGSGSSMSSRSASSSVGSAGSQGSMDLAELGPIGSEVAQAIQHVLGGAPSIMGRKVGKGELNLNFDKGSINLHIGAGASIGQGRALATEFVTTLTTDARIRALQNGI